MTFDDGIIGFHWSQMLHWSPMHNQPLVFYIQLRYANGAITSTGLREHHLQPILEWSEQQDIKIDKVSWNIWRFENKDDASLVLLRWT